jgi:hypothetical protein
MAGAAMIAAAMSAVEKRPSFISFLLFEADCIGCENVSDSCSAALQETSAHIPSTRRDICRASPQRYMMTIMYRTDLNVLDLLHVQLPGTLRRQPRSRRMTSQPDPRRELP